METACVYVTSEEFTLYKALEEYLVATNPTGKAWNGSNGGPEWARIKSAWSAVLESRKPKPRFVMEGSGFIRDTRSGGLIGASPELTTRILKLLNESEGR